MTEDRHRAIVWGAAVFALLIGCRSEPAGECDGGADCGDDVSTIDGGFDGGACVGPTPEECDGVDNDCDGHIDEALPAIATTCGDDACPSRGEMVCERGDWFDTCVAEAPAEEVCDGVDNDCNGQVDDLGPCYDGPPGSEGVGACVPGQWQCDPETGRVTCEGQITPRNEVGTRGGNPIDEDCDGAVDELSILAPRCVDEACEDSEVSTPVDDLEPGVSVPIVVFLRIPPAGIEGDDGQAAGIERMQDGVIADMQDLADGAGFHFDLRRRYSALWMFAADADPDALRLLLAHADVEAVMHDFRLHTSLAHVDDLVGASRARARVAYPGAGTIAHIDTGLNHDHPIFGQCAAQGPGHPGCSVLAGANFLPLGPPDATTDSSPAEHGTLAADIMLALAPSARILPIRVFGPDGTAAVSDLLAAIDWLLQPGAPVVDVAYIGGTTRFAFNGPDCAAQGGHFGRIATVVGRLEARGIVVVAPTGNEGRGLVSAFPACLGNVMAVGATYSDVPQQPPIFDVCQDPQPMVDHILCNSDGHRSGNIAVNEINAPAGPVMARIRNVVVYGTSAAAAAAAAAVAELRAAYPLDTPGRLRERLRDAAVPSPQPFVQAGRLSLDNAIGLVCVDTDGDLFGRGPGCQAEDCDDTRADVFPGAVEICDDVDNDCDLDTDEGFSLGQACTSHLGICAQQGVLQCTPAGIAGCSASGLAHLARAETCNGTDEDCDGSVDEGLVRRPCITGLPGVCADGEDLCVGGAPSCEALRQPSPERCNGLDDDCDGRVDEQAIGVGSRCDTGRVGSCANGAQSCVGGSLVCQGPAPQPEVCDGADNDCDGQIDDAVVGLDDSCGIGGSGREVCQGGRPQCVGERVCRQRTVGAVNPLMVDRLYLVHTGDGDRDFHGNGPVCDFSMRLSIAGQRQIVATVRGECRESEPDWTSGVGSLTDTVVTAANGCSITSIDTATYVEREYTDNSHQDDELDGVAPVRTWHARGDSRGNDVLPADPADRGAWLGHAGVEVELAPITYTECCPAP